MKHGTHHRPSGLQLQPLYTLTHRLDWKGKKKYKVAHDHGTLGTVKCTCHHIKDISIPTRITMNGVSVPFGLVSLIFEHLNAKTLAECKLVCRAFRYLASDPFLYTELPGWCTPALDPDTNTQVWRLKNVPFPVVLDFVVPFRRLYKWHFSPNIEYSLQNMETLALCIPRLQYIDASLMADWSDWQIRLLSELWVDLKFLRISRWLQIDVSNLVDLEVASSTTEGGTNFDLKSLTLQRLRLPHVENVLQLLLDCPNLQDLTLYHSDLDQYLTSDSLRKLSVYKILVPDALLRCPRLNFLSLYDMGSTESMANSSTVTVLNVRGGGFFSSTVLDKFKNVTSLVFGCLGCGNEEGSLVEGFASKTLLRLEIMGELPQVCHLPNLTHLTSRKYMLPPVAFPALQTLSVPDFLNQSSVEETVRQCPKLERIYLQANPFDLGLESSVPLDREWQKLANCNINKNVKFVVDGWRRGSMPPAFDQLFREGRAGYNSNETR
ncbi:hypothetical protein SARC_10013 [Sphaeroforma arctica JP610]|uniref:F-box domain-containing protein n=1 Tax=Sphaeroforma arctica JP610 TaxID=667725 RepID=A0A0L0FL68_9EUKA|nr:hypothetical protein SARC_10013 [Sphaeroforma arctica JP610]KNC77524.1 hypothetical protein SARC_10013 [Sphaeroforma arctica JP610]|eukprot:XP_014151426.1 hypothetical protein SARC_10013 [Sphaeroforma arctica JP610]